ncbi:unnamed protein product [Moneuplotes crassus]|uniref:Uncharacterized protein n=1 Tax=Euplotes crassus TaxID=5936 RepID=A0AAD1XZP2_EUPCR|nr:unnamed protein product [Moneuplotes crassus]
MEDKNKESRPTERRRADIKNEKKGKWTKDLSIHLRRKIACYNYQFKH